MTQPNISIAGDVGRSSVPSEVVSADIVALEATGAAGVLGRGTTLQQALQTVTAVGAMPVTLHVRVPLSCFRLQALSGLTPGSIVTTNWPTSEDLPVSAGGIRIAWAEFAITDQKRAVRVTRIS